MANGVYDTNELPNHLIQELNALPKFLIDNQFIAFSTTIGRMAQELRLLKEGIASDLANREEQIEHYKQMLREQGLEVDTIPIDEYEPEVTPDGD